MLRLTVVAVLVVVAVASEWEEYKQSFGKVYQGDEDLYRQQVYMDNLAYIEAHNAMADRGLVSFRLGVNQFADMSNAEFRQQMNGLLMSTTESGAEVLRAPASTAGLPDTVDWRTKGYVTPVKNQKQCGSCWAFSTTGSLEGQHFNKTGKLVSLSEQNLVDCSQKEGNHGCGGGLMDYAFTYIKKNHGIDTEESYPYTAKNGRCHFKKEDVGATLTSYKDVQKDSEDALQMAVATVGPISVGIDAGHPSFQLYKSGVYEERLCSSTRLDHGVLAVGYGKEGAKDYWLVKNSWGESWGEQGYIKMMRNHKNMCGIATQASYPIV